MSVYFVPLPEKVWNKRRWDPPSLEFPIDSVEIVTNPIPSIIDKLITEGISPDGEQVFFYALKHKLEPLVSILGPMTRKAPGFLTALVAVNDQEGAEVEPGHRIGYTIPGSTFTWRIKKVGEEGYVDVEAWMRGDTPKIMVRDDIAKAKKEGGGLGWVALALAGLYLLKDK